MPFDALPIQRTFASYNAWMNEKLLASCSTLDDASRKTPLPVPFGSLHGLWNHLLVADHLWMSRFQKTPLPFEFQALSMELFADFDELRAARLRMDERICEFAANLSEDDLSSILRWQPSTNPTPRTLPLSFALAHFWNHQTHHRGQITAVMELLGLDCGVTDLLMMPGLV